MINARIFLILISSIVSFEVNAQTYFNNTYGDPMYYDEFAAGMILTSDNEYFIEGFSADTNLLYSLSIIKIDSAGNLIFEKKYGDSGKVVSPGRASLCKTITNQYIVIGESFVPNSGHSDIFVAKLNEDGDTIFLKKIQFRDIVYASGIIELRDHLHYAMTGNTNYQDSSIDITLVKTDTAGNVMWIKTYDSGNDDQGNDVIECNDDGFLITGQYDYYVDFNGIHNSTFILKTDSVGNQKWLKLLYYNKINTAGVSIIQSNDSNYIVCGRISLDSSKFTSGFITKVNQQGNKIWEKFYQLAPEHYSAFSTVISDPHGGYVIAGSSNDTLSRPFGWIIKVDENGDSLWSHTYHKYYVPSAIGEFTDFKICNDSTYIACGYSNFCCGYGHEDYWVVKIG